MYGLPTGWAHEPADPSVGIFGEAFWHEDCATADGGTPGEATATYDANYVTYTCVCGDSIELQTGPDPDDLRDERDYF